MTPERPPGSGGRPAADARGAAAADAGPGSAEPASGTVRSVYVHAPFCARRCGYCDFAVQVRRSGDPAAWAAAIGAELASVRGEGVFVLAPVLDTLYVGGGTPSLLGPRAMELLAEALGRDRVRGGGIEWTAEANPESFTEDVARAWARAGVNRVSLGVQSFDDAVLRGLGRLHGAAGAALALARARAAGLDNLNVDLIFSLPRELRRSWTGDLERALALEVPHVSLYGLTIEPGTPLARRVEEGREHPADESRYREEYLEAVETLTHHGYVHYEVSNFALPGKESRHNEVYWSGAPYLGLGNSAHSYLHPLRRWNLRDWNAYEEAARGGRPPVQDHEVLDAPQSRLEAVWLGLRTRRGVPMPPPASRGYHLVAQWVKHGWAHPPGPDAFVRLTPGGWLLLDRLAVELDAALDAGTVWTPRKTSAKPATT